MSDKAFKIEYLKKTDYPLWDEFVESSPQGTFFNSVKWLQILSSVYNRTLRILVCKNKTEIRAGIIFFENKRFTWKLITPVFLLPFNGPLFADNQNIKYQKSIADNLHLSQLIIDKLHQDYNYIVLDTHYSTNDVRSFLWQNFSTKPIYSYLCNIDKNIESNFNQSLRKKIRKCSEHQVQIFESEKTELFLSFYENSYSRHKLKPPIQLPELKLLVENILTLDNSRLYLVGLDGEPVAGRIILEHKQIIYDLLAGSIDQSGLASSFLVAEIMKKYASDFFYFDFLGADHPEIEQFKRGFGGKLVHRFRITSPASFPLSFLLKLRESNLRAGRNL